MSSTISNTSSGNTYNNNNNNNNNNINNTTLTATTTSVSSDNNNSTNTTNSIIMDIESTNNTTAKKDNEKEFLLSGNNDHDDPDDSSNKETKSFNINHLSIPYIVHIVQTYIRYSIASIGYKNNNDGTTTTNNNNNTNALNSNTSSTISRTGMYVLLLLTIQNCCKNLLVRFVMKQQQAQAQAQAAIERTTTTTSSSKQFCTSIAVIGSELIKLIASVLYIVIIERRSFDSIYDYVINSNRMVTLLIAIPATAYNIQMTLEYVAMKNITAPLFAVIVQTKLLATAVFAYLVLKKQLSYQQITSLVILMMGVMFCNISSSKKGGTSSLTDTSGNFQVGIMATIGIALLSGFASVYTEKVIKGNASKNTNTNVTNTKDTEKLLANSVSSASLSSASAVSGSSSVSVSHHHSVLPTTTTVTVTIAQQPPMTYGLAYTQVQLAFMSLVTMFIYTLLHDYQELYDYGIFHNFTAAVFISIIFSAMGGLIVAAVLKYADSVVKGYATALSVVLTGILSSLLFGTVLSFYYWIGILHVMVAILLYNQR